MNRIAIALLASVAGLAATSARADTRVNLGIAIGAPAYRYSPPVVVVAPPAALYYAPPAVVYAPPPPRGYWQDVQVKTWVPERWVVRNNRWGRPDRYCEPGYYTYTTNQVWVEAPVASRHYHQHDRGLYDRGYYGRDRR